MNRVISTILVVSLLTLAGAPVLAPTSYAPVASAEAAERELMERLAEIKNRMSDIEARMKSGTGKPDTGHRDATMKMLDSIERLLAEIERANP